MTEYSGPPILSELTDKLEGKREELTAWFQEERDKLPMPIYASVDIRDAAWKVAAVDANAYPAGFNNVPPSERDYFAQKLGQWIDSNHPDASWLHIWPESHTRNRGYIENLVTLKNLLTTDERRVTVGSFALNEYTELMGITENLTPAQVSRKGGLNVDGGTPDLIILNNDLSSGPIPDLGDMNIAPPQEMGWYQRRKSSHFQHVQPYIDKAAAILDVDPWLLGTHWFVSEDKCLEKDVCITELAAQVDTCLAYLKGKYEQYGISGDPVLFVKNDSGTYGLGILEIRNGEELLNLSNRKINKLTYGKGGADAVDFLLQEGVPTALKVEDYVIEPCVYGAGGQSCSTFYRANSKKGEMTNLNTPSTVFLKPEEMIELDGGAAVLSIRDGWHALVAELAMLAMGSELAEHLEN